jgi:phosphate transport system substrate-binding protein
MAILKFYQCLNDSRCGKANNRDIISIPFFGQPRCPECEKGLKKLNFHFTVKLVILMIIFTSFILGIGISIGLFVYHNNVSTPIPIPSCPQAMKTLLRFHGSNTIGSKLLPDMAEAFMKDEGFDKIYREYIVVGERNGQSEQIVINARGSDTAFDDLKDNLCDIGMSSRPINLEDKKKLPPILGDLSSRASEHIIALDGIALIVHQSNPVKTLSIAQVSDIFSGTNITDWSQLGGSPGKIAIYARDNKSGTYAFFNEAVLQSHGKSIDKDAKRFEDSWTLSESVSSDPNGIGFIGLNYIGQNKAIALSDTDIEARKASLLAIKTEDYILSRRLYLYNSSNQSNPNVKKFIEFAEDSKGQEVVNKAGFVNLEPTIYPSDPDDVRNKSLRWKQLTNKAMEISTHFRFKSKSDKYNFDNKAYPDLNRIGHVLTNQYSNNKVILIGFADNRGSRDDNCKFSEDRAKKVKEALMITTNGLITFDDPVGLCDDAPIATNDTEENLEKNRRVEVWVKPK